MNVARHGAGMIILQDHLHVTLPAMQVLLVELRAQLFLLAGQGLVGGQRFSRQFGKHGLVRLLFLIDFIKLFIGHADCHFAIF